MVEVWVPLFGRTVPQVQEPGDLDYNNEDFSITMGCLMWGIRNVKTASV